MSTDGCQPRDETFRSIWSILGSCALTLLLCLWHTVHLNIPKADWRASFLFEALSFLGSLFAPEVMVVIASGECWDAYKKVLRFREKGYNWSMTHSFFAEWMGGFVYRDSDAERDDDDLPTIDSRTFLEHCENNIIANPFIRVKHIRALGKSDWLGQVILALQLFWFILQVVVRGSEGLAITLVELDTLCMAVLSLFVILLWWHKPLRAERPHVFYSTRDVNPDESRRDMDVSFSTASHSLLIGNERKRALSTAWRPEPTFPDWSTVCFAHRHDAGDEEANAKFSDAKPLSKFEKVILMSDETGMVSGAVPTAALSLAWLILGLLHLIAWNFEFPTGAEKISWRAASLVLTGSSLVMFGACAMDARKDVWDRNAPGWARDKLALSLCIFAGTLGVVSRALLVCLVLASLRALPCSAYRTVF